MTMTRVMTGMSLVGRVFNDPIVATQVLTGQLELEIKYSFYYMEKKELPFSEVLEDINTPEVSTRYNKLLDLIRSELSHALRMVEIKNNMLERKQKHIDEVNRKRDIEKRLKELSAPHPLGTVKEICEKYNISKSLVRKMKADGTLEDFCLAEDVKIKNTQ